MADDGDDRQQLHSASQAELAPPQQPSSSSTTSRTPSPSPPAPPQVHRTLSAPPPITVEDVTNSEPARSVRIDSVPVIGSEIEDKATRDARRPSTWHHRKRSPGVEWPVKLTKESFDRGRVLLIDYVSKEHTQQGRRKIVSQEFADVHGLRKFYANEDLSHQAALRIIHVQNASWATQFLLHKFNINPHDDIVGTTFGRWAKYDRPQRRAGKPVLNGKTFRTQRDPWRGISRTAFGLDYLRQYDPRTPVVGVAAAEANGVRRRNRRTGASSEAAEEVVTVGDQNDDLKMMELNGYGDGDNPSYLYDVFVQRLSVYIQRSEEVVGVPPALGQMRNPYDEAQYAEYQRWRKQYRKDSIDDEEKYIPRLKTLDSGNTIIVFEHSHSGSVDDTLIGARQEIESRWRRLTFYLSREETATDERLAIECMDLIFKDIFKAMAYAWEKYLNCCATHVSILEDKIYDNPADESRAPELWTNASLWLKVEKLMFIHCDIVKEMRSHLKELLDDDEPGEWFESTLEEFDKLANTIQEDLIKPTAALSDLMYKSVEIRDSRHSLQLGTSMWRLSWITFIFLPLTFIVGFFGMNVDTFESYPHIRYYFAAAVPLMVLVIILWFIIKHALAQRHQDPLRRGVYENLFHDFATQHPRLWSRNGPRDTVVPRGLISTLKWRLLSFWFAPERTTTRGRYDPTDEELSFWGRVKRRLAARWLGSITVAPSSAAADMGESGLLVGPEGAPAVQELIALAQPIAVAEGEPRAARASTPPAPGPMVTELEAGARRSRFRMRTRTRTGGRSASRSRSRSTSPRASADDGSVISGLMVDEKAASSDEDREETPDDRHRRDAQGVGLRDADNRVGTAARPGSGGKSRSSTVSDLLSVPILPGRASEQEPEWT